ncbi:hypothetical protein H2200_011594 [Cladophialophora chaetospira]|uniref:Zn(2)-C6 fungal-type domain-containing protein n=1 Tax=Cladophialophora chaetospira TaxID=386627 RepID=A0AA39CDA7_9EURO|nr:hypothetical protein H2200_011594 [Cladophialophora chaetospira]
MPVPQQGKRQRRWAPKTRTGCKTCKIRRKKCDEKRPSCSRCLKDKFPCDGYEPPKAWVFEQGEAPRVVVVDRSRSSMDSSLCSRSPSTKTDCIHDRNREGEEVEEVDRVEPWDLVRRDSRLSDFLLEPSNPWTSSLDQNFTQYFLLKTAPLLSSTRRWQNFWRVVVPQAAWANESVRHAMIAVSLTFDTYISGTDHKGMILSRRNRAITAFASEPSSSWEVGLIVCRLFSSMAQCNQDFEGAMTHMKSGEKMLLEATRNGVQNTSEVGKLMAATFMGLFADSTIDFDVIKRFPSRARQRFRVLQTVCSEYAHMLRRVTHLHWDFYGKVLTRRHITQPEWEETIDTASMGFLSVVFTTFNQAISSAMYPDLLVFPADDGIVPVAEVRATLVAEDRLISFDALSELYRPLFDDVETYFRTPPGLLDISNQDPPKYALPTHLRTRLIDLVDNYVVQAADLEPRMTAGTFWLPCSVTPGCLMDAHQDPPNLGVLSCLHRPCSGHQHAHEDEVTRERREYYHEFVCQYRSGFMI